MSHQPITVHVDGQSWISCHHSETSHYYHTRLHRVFTSDELAASPQAHDCVLPVVQFGPKRTRVTMTVTVDLDPIPGMCHELSDWVRWLQQYIGAAVPHYHPVVEAMTPDVDEVNQDIVDAISDHHEAMASVEMTMDQYHAHVRHCRVCKGEIKLP